MNGADVYQLEVSNPAGELDPSGLDVSEAIGVLESTAKADAAEEVIGGGPENLLADLAAAATTLGGAGLALGFLFHHKQPAPAPPAAPVAPPTPVQIAATPAATKAAAVMAKAADVMAKATIDASNTLDTLLCPLSAAVKPTAPSPQTAAGGGGQLPPIIKAIAGDGPNEHHRLPQAKALQEFFKNAGLDIEEWTRNLFQNVHFDLHNFFDYVPKWIEFMENNRQATAEDILDFMLQLEAEFGLPPWPF